MACGIGWVPLRWTNKPPAEIVEIMASKEPYLLILESMPNRWYIYIYILWPALSTSSVYVCSKQFIGWEGFLRSHHGQCSIKFYRQICIQKISAHARKKVKYKNSCTVSKLCPHAEEFSSSSDSFLVPVFAANFLFHPSIPFFCLSAVLRILGVLGLSVAGSGFRFLGVEGVDPETVFLTVFRIFAMRSLIARVVGTSLSFAILLSKRKSEKKAVRKWTYARHLYVINPLSVTDSAKGNKQVKEMMVTAAPYFLCLDGDVVRFKKLHEKLVQV